MSPYTKTPICNMEWLIILWRAYWFCGVNIDFVGWLIDCGLSSSRMWSWRNSPILILSAWRLQPRPQWAHMRTLSQLPWALLLYIYVRFHMCIKWVNGINNYFCMYSVRCVVYVANVHTSKLHYSTCADCHSQQECFCLASADTTCNTNLTSLSLSLILNASVFQRILLLLFRSCWCWRRWAVCWMRWTGWSPRRKPRQPWTRAMRVSLLTTGVAYIFSQVALIIHHYSE